VLDRAKSLERLGGDEVLLGEIARLFLLEYPALVAQIHAARDKDDARVMERAAHSLKGAAANFCAAPTVDAALALEQLARAGDLAGADKALTRLEAELARMHAALSELAK
jgi:HPt (histidine-containing phosphotransfer) domain-containing protein